MTIAPFLIGKGQRDIFLRPEMANRHGLVAGATGTGKTVTLRVLTEHFSAIGTPVFLADVKGDLTGLAAPGGDHPKIVERAAQLGLAMNYSACPVVFWDLFGQQGHPVRATVSDMGPLLLARILNLNEVQAGLLNVVFRVADDNGLLLLDLKDLRAMVQFVGEHAQELRLNYGNVSAASVGAVQRNLLVLEDQGADRFFGEPALDPNDFLQTDASGQGLVNILAADQLIRSPKLYATFLLWLLSELHENLPEVGDPAKPKLVFFFDEAHLLFEDLPGEVLAAVTQVVRLIRSKGVGVWFVTQNPADVPDVILGQLGNRIQHALRAYTPKDREGLRAAAKNFRENPAVDTEAALTELAIGEGLVSVLDAKGAPEPVERAFICPPRSRMAPLTPQERAAILQTSLVAGHYDQTLDRESAYEQLAQRAPVLSHPAPGGPQPTEASSEGGLLDTLTRTLGGSSSQRPGTRQRQTPLEAFATSTIRAVGSALGRQIARGVLGTLFGGRR